MPSFDGELMASFPPVSWVKDGCPISSGEADCPLISAKSDLYIVVLIRCAQERHNRIPVGEIDVSQLVFEVVQNLSGRQNDAFHRWLQALQGLFRQRGQQLVFSNFALIVHLTQLRCACSTAKEYSRPACFHLVSEIASEI